MINDTKEGGDNPNVGVPAQESVAESILPTESFKRVRGTGSVVAQCWQVVMNNPKGDEGPIQVLVTADTAIRAILRAAELEQIEVLHITNVGARLMGLVYI